MDGSVKDSPVIARLIRLLDAGYVVNVKYSAQMGDVLELEHPAGRRRVQEPSLFLRADGLLYGGPTSGSASLVIEPEELAEFDALIQRTPKPTWWERNRRPFDVATAWLLILAFVFVVHGVVQYASNVIKGW